MQVSKTKLRVFSSFLIFLFSLHSFAQTKIEPAAATFLNWHIHFMKHNRGSVPVRRVNSRIVSWDSNDLNALIPDPASSSFIKGMTVRAQRLDTIFSKADFKSLKEQITALLNLEEAWPKGVLKGVKLVEFKTPKIIGKGEDYWEYSKPLFSLDKKKCIVKINYLCGPLCASWEVILFEKTVAGKWKKSRVLYGAVS
jgi:hypothetical protein